MTTTARHLLAAGALATTAVLSFGTSVSADAATAATIRFTGTVVEPGDYPVPGVVVSLVRESDGAAVGKARTDSRGTYWLPAVPRSSKTQYSISTTDPAGLHLDSLIESVPATATRAREDIQLSNAGVIRGQVSTRRGDDVEPATDVEVYAENSRSFGSVRVASSGAFRLGGLPAGTYRLDLQDLSGTFSPICYDNVVTESTGCSGTLVKVTSGSVTTIHPQVFSHLEGPTG